MKLYKYLVKSLSRKQQTYKNAHSNADACIDNTVYGVGDVCINGSVEEKYAKYDTAGLNGAYPFAEVACQNEKNNAHEDEQQHKGAGHTVGIDKKIETKQYHSQNAADYGTEKAVSAVELGAGHIAAYAENRTDAGKGGIAVNKEIYEGAKSCGQCAFNILLTYMKMPVCFVHREKPRFVV